MLHCLHVLYCIEFIKIEVKHSFKVDFKMHLIFFAFCDFQLNKRLFSIHIFHHWGFLKNSVKISSRLVLVNPISCLVSSRGVSVSSHPYSPEMFRFWILWTGFALRLSLYFGALSFSSTLMSSSVPAAEKQPHSMRLLPAHFTFGMLLCRRWAELVSFKHDA